MRALIIVSAVLAVLLAGCTNPGTPPATTADNSSIAAYGSPQDNVVGTPVPALPAKNATQPPPENSSGSSATPMHPANNSTPVTSGSGGQIVDVGGSIPVSPTPSGSGN
jgi:hypothetical protein